MPQSIVALLTSTRDAGASDLHISAGMPPIIRQRGEIVRANLPAMSAEETRAMVYEWSGLAPDQIDGDVETLRAETDERIPEWNETGRLLCLAFLGQAEDRGSDRKADGAGHEGSIRSLPLRRQSKRSSAMRLGIGV